MIALSEILPGVSATETGSVAIAAAAAAERLNISEPAAQLRNRAADENSEPELRARALAALARQSAEDVSSDVSIALQSRSAVLRRQAVLLINQTEMSHPLKRLLDIIRHDSSVAVQQAALDMLSDMDDDAVDEMIAALLNAAASDRLSAELHLELIEATASRSSASVDDALHRLLAQRPAADPVAPWWELLYGGSATAGQQIFLSHPAAQCIRCHDTRDKPGKAGPSLSDVGARLSRRKLLESVLFPNAVIADGFARTVLVLDDGGTREGVIVTEHGDEITLRLLDGSLISVSKDSVEERSASHSAMPRNIADKLSKREIRDLVEFLASSRTTHIKTGHTAGANQVSEYQTTHNPAPKSVALGKQDNGTE